MLFRDKVCGHCVPLKVLVTVGMRIGVLAEGNVPAFLHMRYVLTGISCNNTRRTTSMLILIPILLCRYNSATCEQTKSIVQQTGKETCLT